MATTDLPNDPMSRLARSVFTLNGLLLHSGEVVAGPLGQSSARWHVLGRANSEPRSVSDIARYIGVSRQSVQRIANVLEREGLVEFRNNPLDRRAPLVHVTAAGAAVLAELYARDAILTRRLMDGLDPDQILALSDALETVSTIFGHNLESVDAAILERKDD